MNRKELIQLWLGLIIAVKTGVVNDVLWMGHGNTTIFEALGTALNVDEPECQDLDYLEELLENELQQIGGSR